MTHAGTELVLVHFRKGLIEIPMVVVEAIHSAHHSGAMTPTRAMQIKLAGGRIVYYLQERIHLVHAGIALINHGDVYVAQSGSFNRWLLVFPGVISQINHGLNAERGES